MQEYIKTLEEVQGVSLADALMFILQENRNKLFTVEILSEESAGLVSIGTAPQEERRAQFKKIYEGLEKIAEIVKRETEREVKKYKSLELQLHSNNLDLLDKYNKFLQKNGYTDSDVDVEEPTAINQFLEELKETTCDCETGKVVDAHSPHCKYMNDTFGE